MTVPRTRGVLQHVRGNQSGVRKRTSGCVTDLHAFQKRQRGTIEQKSPTGSTCGCVLKPGGGRRLRAVDTRDQHLGVRSRWPLIQRQLSSKVSSAARRPTLRISPPVSSRTVTSQRSTRAGFVLPHEGWGEAFRRKKRPFLRIRDPQSCLAGSGRLLRGAITSVTGKEPGGSERDRDDGGSDHARATSLRHLAAYAPAVEGGRSATASVSQSRSGRHNGASTTAHGKPSSRALEASNAEPAHRSDS
jgi:hypothetical protein